MKNLIIAICLMLAAAAGFAKDFNYVASNAKVSVTTFEDKLDDGIALGILADANDYYELRYNKEAKTNYLGKGENDRDFANKLYKIIPADELKTYIVNNSKVAWLIGIIDYNDGHGRVLIATKSELGFWTYVNMSDR